MFFFIVCPLPCFDCTKTLLLAEAQLHLEALQSNLDDLVKKREFDTQAYEVGFLYILFKTHLLGRRID